MCGGVRTDIDARTDVPGLLAAGEVAHTGVHGANRLASNSLLEAVVFAERAADSTLELLSAAAPVTEPPARATGTASARGFAELRRALRAAMWEGAGIVRSDETLAEAARRIEELAARAPRSPGDPAAAEIANLMLVARLVVTAASLRKESRGLHFNRSHPIPDPAFQRDTTLLPNQLKEYVT
jgi:L-aspartate oxidase